MTILTPEQNQQLRELNNEYRPILEANNHAQADLKRAMTNHKQAMELHQREYMRRRQQILNGNGNGHDQDEQ